VLAPRVNPPVVRGSGALVKQGDAAGGWGSGESAGAGDPCLRCDKGRQKSVPLGSGSSSVVSGITCKESASAARSESGGTCR